MGFKIVMNKHTEPEHSYDSAHVEYDVLSGDAKIGEFTLSSLGEYQPDFSWYLDQAYAEKVTSEEFLGAIFKYLRGQGIMHVNVYGSYRDYSPWFGFILTHYDNSGWEPRYNLYRCLYDFGVVEDLDEHGKIYALINSDNGSVLCTARISYEKEERPSIVFERSDNQEERSKGRLASLLVYDFQLTDNTKAILSEFLYNLEIIAAQQLLDYMFIQVPVDDPLIKMLDEWEPFRKFEHDNQTFVLLKKNVELRAY